VECSLEKDKEQIGHRLGDARASKRVEKQLKDAARRGATRATCRVQRSSHPPASRVQRPCVSACVRTRCRHRRAHTRRRGRDNRWLRVAAGESSTISDWLFLCTSRDHRFPPPPFVLDLPLFSRRLSRSRARLEPAENRTRSISSSLAILTTLHSSCEGMMCATTRRCGRTAP